MTHVDKSSPPRRHLQYFCHTCSAIYRTLPLHSLDDSQSQTSSFKITSLIHKMLVSRSTSLITGSDNYYMTRVEAMMNSLMKCGKKRQQR